MATAERVRTGNFQSLAYSQMSPEQREVYEKVRTIIVNVLIKNRFTPDAAEIMVSPSTKFSSEASFDNVTLIPQIITDIENEFKIKFGLTFIVTVMDFVNRIIKIQNQQTQPKG